MLKIYQTLIITLWALPTLQLLRMLQDISYGIKGVNGHDVRLVAAMPVYVLTHILTFNIGDFARYLEIITVNPTAILP